MVLRKKYKFNVDFYLDEINSVSFIHGLLFAKLRLLPSRKTKYISERKQIEDHSVKWFKKINFVCKMTANALSGCLESCYLRISIRKEVNGGITYQKLGFVDVDLAEFASCGLTSKLYLLEGYKDSKIHRQDNSTLKVQVDCTLIRGDPLFIRPTKSNSSFYISETSSKENTIINRSEFDNSLISQNNLFLNKANTVIDDDILTKEKIKNATIQNFEEKSDEIITSETIKNEDCSLNSISSGSDSNFNLKNDQKFIKKNLIKDKIESNLNENFIENDKLFDINYSRKSSSISSKVSNGYENLFSNLRKNSGDSTSVKNLNSRLNEFLKHNNVQNKTISSFNVKHSINKPSLFNQFSTLQPSHINFRRNFLNESKNFSLNEINDNKVDSTRVNCEQLINEIIETNLKNEGDSSVTESEVGLELFLAKDGTAKLGTRSSYNKNRESKNTFKSTSLTSASTSKLGSNLDNKEKS